MDKSITAAIKRFPHHWHRIRFLGERDATFNSICGDYLLAMEALAQWQATNGPEVLNRVGEYQAVVEELEEEIQQYLLSNANDNENIG